MKDEIHFISIQERKQWNPETTNILSNTSSFYVIPNGDPLPEVNRNYTRDIFSFVVEEFQSLTSLFVVTM